jgi:UDP-glucose 4-epimerase
MPLYLVTGVAGFIGNNLARALVERGDTNGAPVPVKVRGIDNFATGRKENLDGIAGHPDFDFIEGDITDPATIGKAMAGVDYVLHQAAIPSVPRSIQDPVATHHANVTGTLRVLEAARHAKVKRLVYASSSSVYGDTPILPKREDMPTNPRSPYAVSKLAGEQYAMVYSRVFGLPCVALRYFNVFGPRQDPNSQYAAVIPKFIQCALRNEPPPVHGDGKQSRDFTFIDNVIEANLKACIAEGAAGEVFNAACGDRFTLLDLVDGINAVLGTHVTPTHLPARAGDVRDSQADIAKARRALGYTASVSFMDGLRHTITWYRDHT